MFRPLRISTLPILAILCFAGCHNPARPSPPQIDHSQREARWREELVPGRRADWVMGYLLEQGFDCQISRDGQGRVIAIAGSLSNPARDANGERRNWRIEVAIQKDAIETVKFTPLSPPR